MTLDGTTAFESLIWLLTRSGGGPRSLPAMEGRVKRRMEVPPAAAASTAPKRRMRVADMVVRSTRLQQSWRKKKSKKW